MSGALLQKVEPARLRRGAIGVVHAKLAIAKPTHFLVLARDIDGAPLRSGPRFAGAGPAKWLLDGLGATCLLLLLLPVMCLIALAVRADGGPVLFRHTRIGQGGRTFGCLKFRSMVIGADRKLAEHLAADLAAAAEWAERRKLANDPRVTRLGRFLRSTSLDELPQLFNVLRGDMSLVGPRPVVQEELAVHYGATGTAAYMSVRPGITGLWQISGRSETTYHRRVSLDIHYASSVSVLRDIGILLRTVPAVLARRGAV